MVNVVLEVVLEMLGDGLLDVGPFKFRASQPESPRLRRMEEQVDALVRAKRRIRSKASRTRAM